MQLRVFAEVAKRVPGATLTFIGGVRNEDDAARVSQLKTLAYDDLKIPRDSVRFLENAPYSDLLLELSTAHVGLHAMCNEHFGISVVEYMAAGCVTVAHGSAAGEATGFLPRTEREYVEVLVKVLGGDMTPEETTKMQLRARERVGRFSSEEFHKDVLRLLEPMLF
eukprot:PhM_4_TR18249/c0_g1_i1/m.80334/K03844/ALG11; alpha-1,2-mannosyltransferase